MSTPPDPRRAAPGYTPAGRGVQSGSIMQSLNFEFLRGRRPAMADLAGFAERYAYSDPPSCLLKVRALLEQMVECIYVEQRLPRPDRAGLNDLMLQAMFEDLVPRVVREKMHAMRVRGNKAAHGEAVHRSTIEPLLRHAHDVARRAVPASAAATSAATPRGR